MTGAILGPALTKWYQLLNRIKFPSPTKAVVYRVHTFFLHLLAFALTNGVRRYGLIKQFFHQVRWYRVLFHVCYREHVPSISAAVAFFFGTMSILEGKGFSGAVERIGTVSPPLRYHGNCLTFSL